VNSFFNQELEVDEKELEQKLHAGADMAAAGADIAAKKAAELDEHFQISGAVESFLNQEVKVDEAYIGASVHAFFAKTVEQFAPMGQVLTDVMKLAPTAARNRRYAARDVFRSASADDLAADASSQCSPRLRGSRRRVVKRTPRCSTQKRPGSSETVSQPCVDDLEEIAPPIELAPVEVELQAELATPAVPCATAELQQHAEPTVPDATDEFPHPADFAMPTAVQEEPDYLAATSDPGGIEPSDGGQSGDERNSSLRSPADTSSQNPSVGEDVAESATAAASS